jgi:D-arabinose 1-dehydrogenase-like Zn-dependent alcohol dehydrogenase
MKATWYEKQGAARDVLVIGDMEDPQPHAGEVRIRIAFSGVNPGDVKKREDAFGVGMPYPRVVPHSDGSGTVDLVGEGVSREWVGQRVWCYGAQSYRPFGTAAEYTVIPLKQVVQLPANFSLEEGACLGISGHNGSSGGTCRRSGQPQDLSLDKIVCGSEINGLQIFLSIAFCYEWIPWPVFCSSGWASLCGCFAPAGAC